MIHLVTYATDNMSKSAELCKSSAKEHGVDFVFQHKNIDGFFYLLNKDILDAPRGAGYWLWKPYVIAEAMQWIKDGDILIYSDAGVEFVNDVKHIIDVMDEDIFLFGNEWNHWDWCKMDVMKSIYFDAYGSMKQVQASVIFFKVNANTRRFVREWLAFCQVPGFIDDSPSKLTNHHEFREHRHDQAILTCLAYKYGYKLHRWPTQYAGVTYHQLYPEDKYPQIFNHHRLRNDQW